MGLGTKTATRELKHYYSDAELREKMDKLASANLHIVELGNRKKEVVSQIQTEINEANSAIDKLAKEISQRWMYKNVKCEVRMDTPREGWKQIVRIDTQEVVETEEMTFNEIESERQLELPIPDAAAAPGEETPTAEAVQGELVMAIELAEDAETAVSPEDADDALEAAEDGAEEAAALAEE